MFSSMSLRRHLLITISVPLFVISVVGTAFDFRLARLTADAAFDFALKDAVLDLAAHAQMEMPDLGLELASEAEVLSRSNGVDVLYFSASDEAGQLLAGEADLNALVNPISTLSLDTPTLFDREFRQQSVRMVVYKVKAKNGSMTIAVAETVKKRLLASHDILAAMLVPELFLVLAIFWAVYFGVRRGLARLDDVENEISRRSPTDLQAIDILTVPEEIRPTLTRLNQLFLLLSRASGAQQRFLADAAHQLRTPLAGLQTQIDLATTEGLFKPDSERLRRINDSIGRLDHLVNQLLTYSRTENASQSSLNFEPVYLDELVEQSASLFLDQALSKHIDLGFEVAPATVLGVTWMIREALANLIDNALRYTPAHGRVTVICSQTATDCRLTVEDNGPGIPAEQREPMFDRFYRLPGTLGDGCGLGLAIVRDIAQLHRADVLVADASPGGLHISMIFVPCASPRH